MPKTIRTIFFALLALAFAVPAVSAQNVPSKKEAKELLRKAAADSELRGSGAAPFHLLANFKYTLDNNTVDGMYELFWAAPDKYREYFKMGDVVETDIAAGNKLYVERSTKAIPLAAVAHSAEFAGAGGATCRLCSECEESLRG